MRVAFYQFAPEQGAVEKNRERLAAVLEGLEADLVVLPELATTGYLFASREELYHQAEPVPGPTTDQLQACAQRRGTHIVIGIAERVNNRCYNSAVLIGPQGVIGIYRKMHLFHEEKELFHPGDLGFPIFNVNGVKVGLLVCFDHFFPEAARTLALQGAQVICHPSNLILPGLGQLTTRVRALENRVFWILANRIGTETRGSQSLTFTGESQIIAPDGTLLVQATSQEERVGLVEIDPMRACDKRVTALNDLFADRRPTWYRL
ncbi:MAG: nitrilase [Blastocatellia bacterium]|nr:nitrilase [Blastocatellia bacterium]MCS7158186.1 nitrilase [Blastocatellia bacterium]MCX7752952.1 nitrilase [Blastocatellia bacterium]MDW8168475.1 nitrilase-related carbon-nitrogen hydrolase [Acidobacteriota bacterium]MDW8256889.1 nitrilase-related carbon-nitrogen hydrolase [Acidobacteriota bacterium]